MTLETDKITIRITAFSGKMNQAFLNHLQDKGGLPSTKPSLIQWYLSKILEHFHKYKIDSDPKHMVNIANYALLIDREHEKEIR